MGCCSPCTQESAITKDICGINKRPRRKSFTEKPFHPLSAGTGPTLVHKYKDNLRNMTNRNEKDPSPQIQRQFAELSKPIGKAPILQLTVNCRIRGFQTGTPDSAIRSATRSVITAVVRRERPIPQFATPRKCGMCLCPRRAAHVSSDHGFSKPGTPDVAHRPPSPFQLPVGPKFYPRASKIDLGLDDLAPRLLQHYTDKGRKTSRYI